MQTREAEELCDALEIANVRFCVSWDKLNGWTVRLDDEPLSAAMLYRLHRVLLTIYIRDNATGVTSHDERRDRLLPGLNEETG